MGEVDPDETTRAPEPLVQRGTPVGFRADGETDAFLGTVHSLQRRSFHMLLQADARPSTAAKTGTLVVVNQRGQKVELSARAKPSGSLLEIEPRPGPPHERPVPRIPVFAPVDVVVLRRDGGALSGNLLDLSMNGCTVRLSDDPGIRVHRNDCVAVSSNLSGGTVDYRGEVIGTGTVRGNVSLRIRFTDIDGATHAITEAFIEQRLEQLATAGQSHDAIHGVITIGDESRTVQLEPGTGALNVDLQAGQSVHAQLRVAGVGPVLFARGITERRGERTHIRWMEIDPITRVLLDR